MEHFKLIMAAQFANLQQKFDEYKASVDKALHDKTKPWYKGFEFAEEKTNVPRSYIFFGKFCCIVKILNNLYTVYVIAFFFLLKIL